MRSISILTPAQKARRDFLRQAGESIAHQVMPPGWTVQWVVQEDGDEPDLCADLASFPFADHRPNRRQLGPGPTRNLALSRAKGELVRVLDSDDLLLPEALAEVIRAFECYPEIHWVASQADDLLPNGQRLACPLPIAAGLILPGTVTDYICLGGTPHIPVHPAGLTIRTSTALALGGWGGYPVGEDSHLLAALAELTPGYLLPTVTWLYRKHPDQITASVDDWQDIARLTTAQRVGAIRKLHLGFGRSGTA